MRSVADEKLDSLWAGHNAEWRDPAQVTAQWRDAADADPRLLQYRVVGPWWDTLAASGATLLVTREYEHLVVALRHGRPRPEITYLRMPHPSGLTVDQQKKVVYVASTRNPNHIYDLVPAAELMRRGDVHIKPLRARPLVPLRSRFYPGCLYLHDLAIIAGKLYGNAVGQNAIVRLEDDGTFKRVWWPRCIETPRGPIFERNHLQLNSIAAGTSFETSYFSASVDRPSARRPGHKNFVVDKRGVIFSGATREPMVTGLTRPHSARLHRGRLWVDNSGYGELGLVADQRFEAVARLPGWTRGLCFRSSIAFVGTSRVIPRFRHYAPGLDVDQAVCGVHAVDLASGRILGSLIWPHGNQVFAVDWIPHNWASRLPFQSGSRREGPRNSQLFYAFSTEPLRRNGK